MIAILHDLLSYLMVAFFAYIMGWVHGANWCKRFIESKANVKIIEASTLTIVPNEPKP